jgi:L-asparagine oxygenase
MEIILTSKELSELLTLARNITASPSEDQELFCKQTKDQSKNIPSRIKEILLTFSKIGSETGVLLIKPIPIDKNSMPETPKGNEFRVGEKTILAKIQAILLSAISDLVSYEAEGYGNLFQDIVPTKCMESVQTSLGSNTELEIHTEQAFSKLRPDILSLACLRGDVNAFTYIFPINKLLEKLTNDEKTLLKNPLWKTGVDLSFKLNNNEFLEGDIRGPMPILSGKPKDPTFVFDQDLMKGITPSAQKIIKKIVDIYYQDRISHNLKPGEIVFIDNNRAVHGRSPFSPKYDGQDRFLIRCFSTYDLNKSQYARNNNSRTIKAIYS